VIRVHTHTKACDPMEESQKQQHDPSLSHHLAGSLAIPLTTEDNPITKKHLGRILSCIHDNSTNPSKMGTLSVVSLCKDDNGKHYVLKRSPKLNRSEAYMVTDLRREAAAVGSNAFAHPSIIKGLGCFETERNIYLCMEHATGGSLLEYMVDTRSSRLFEEEVMLVCRQIFSAVAFIHSVGYIHCDIKLDNVLLMDNYKRIDHNSVLKLADFGYYRDTRNLPQRKSGSPEYAAPELFIDSGTNTDKSDVWSCGVMLYALVYGEMPFAMQPEDAHSGLHTEYAVVTARIRQCPPYRFIHPMRSTSRTPPSLAAINLMRRMLAKDPKQRPTMAECINHDFIIGKPRAASGARPCAMLSTSQALVGEASITSRMAT